jgi:hypothetical protein
MNPHQFNALVDLATFIRREKVWRNLAATLKKRVSLNGQPDAEDIRNGL